MTPRRRAEAGGPSSRVPLPAAVIVPLANPSTAADLIALGCAMLDPRIGELTALGVVEVPEGMVVADGALRARAARRLIQQALDVAPPGRPIQPVVRIARRAAEGILEAAAEREADLIVFGWAGRTPGAAGAPGVPWVPGVPGAMAVPAATAAAAGGSARGRRRGPGGGSPVPWVFSPTIDEVVRAAPCDIAVVNQRPRGAIRSVLVPVRGGPHADLALRLADAVARWNGASVSVLHLLPSGVEAVVRAQAERALAALVREHVAAPASVVVGETDDVRRAMLRSADQADLVVMGASAPDTSPAATAFLLGELPEWIATHARASVMVVRTREALSQRAIERLAQRAETLPAADRAAERTRSVPARVERWFQAATYERAAFADLERLARLRAQRGVTVTVVVTGTGGADGAEGAATTADEAGAAQARAAAMARRMLVDAAGLVDEVLVVESRAEAGAGEAGEEAAAAAGPGLRAVRHPGVLARYGSYRGRGEALWKSVFEASGDIVVWPDPAEDWDATTVAALVGPLLEQPRLQLVRGHRGRVAPDGLTALVARPLLSLFWPELTGIVEPLGRGGAARRGLLEALPLFTGEAVDIGLLIDTFGRVGLAGIAQVALRDEPGPTGGADAAHGADAADAAGAAARSAAPDADARSFAIIAAVMKRLEERRRVRLFAELGATLDVPVLRGDEWTLDVLELADQERPPLLRIPEYLERRATAGPRA